jgi:hypothetical protein
VGSVSVFQQGFCYFSRLSVRQDPLHIFIGMKSVLSSA